MKLVRVYLPAPALLLLGLLIAPPEFGLAQNTGGTPGGGGGNQGGGGTQLGGILIDSAGVVRLLDAPRTSPKAHREAQDEFLRRHLSGDVAAATDRRYVSLVRCEQACERAGEANQAVGEELCYLAGLQRIDFVFVDPESMDLVIAGPAEGFAPDEVGRMVGVTSGRPPLRLDDLIVALRAAFSGVTSIGCSIDPEPQRLAEMQRYVQSNSTQTTPAGAARRYEEMARILGPQNIRTFGVPADSHFAVTLVEADFRMKRISLGVEPSGVRGLSSHLSLLKPGGNSIQRWWFTPFYDSLSANEDHTAFALAGQRVQLLAQDEITSAGGQRSDALTTRASTEAFARMFTERFPELAARWPLFAELQNLFDVAVVAALIHHEQLPQQVGWDMSAFLQADSTLVPTYSAPRHVPSMSTFRKAQRGLVLGLVGGVTIEPRSLLMQMQDNDDAQVRLDGLRRAALESRPADVHAWWWD